MYFQFLSESEDREEYRLLTNDNSYSCKLNCKTMLYCIYINECNVI